MQNTLNHLLLLISFWISGKRKEVKREKSNRNFTLQFTLIIGHTPLPVDTSYSFIQDYIWTDTFAECLLLVLLHLKIIDNQGLTFHEIYIPHNTEILRTGEETEDISKGELCLIHLFYEWAYNTFPKDWMNT